MPRRGARLSDLKLAAAVRPLQSPGGRQATHGAHPGTLSPIKLFVCADPFCQTACCTTTLLKPCFPPPEPPAPARSQHTGVAAAEEQGDATELPAHAQPSGMIGKLVGACLLRRRCRRERAERQGNWGSSRAAWAALVLPVPRKTARSAPARKATRTSGPTMVPASLVCP